MDLFDLVTTTRYSDVIQNVRANMSFLGWALDDDIIQAVRANVSEDDKAVVRKAEKILREFVRHCEELQHQHKLQQEQTLLWKLYKESNWGFVYVMHLWDEIYKIGRSVQPQTRLADVRCGVRQHLNKTRQQKDIIVEIVHKIKTPDMCWAEKALHKRYENKRVEIQQPGWNRLTYNELFGLDDEDLAQIQTIEIMMPPKFNRIKDIIVAESNIPLNNIEWGYYA